MLKRMRAPTKKLVIPIIPPREAKPGRRHTPEGLTQAPQDSEPRRGEEYIHNSLNTSPRNDINGRAVETVLKVYNYVYIDPSYSF